MKQAGVRIDGAMKTTIPLLAAALLVPSAAPAVTLTRGPYLHLASDMSMLVVWDTDEPVNTVVEHGKTTGLGQTDTDPGLVTHHALLLTDLEPATVYHYRIIGDDEVLADGLSFKTAPAHLAADARFRFIAVGDTGTLAQAQLDVALRMKESLADLGLHGGDLVYPGGQPDDLQRKYFDVYRDLIGNVPFYIAIGNKDVEFDGGAEYLAAFHLPENSPSPERFYSFGYGNAFFAALDTNGDLGAGSEQVLWLDSALAESEHTWKIVFLHHAFLSSGPNVAALRPVLQPVLDARKVDLVIQAHNHYYERTFPIRGSGVVDAGEEPAYTDPGGTVYIVTGGGGGTLRPATATETSARLVSTHHHVVVDVNGPELVLTAIDSGGKTIDSMTITKGGARPLFRRGDTDANASLDITDAVRILGYLFLGSPALECLEAADSDDSGELELTDAVRILNHAFLGGPPPEAPGPPPGPCGADPPGSPDTGCAAYDGCGTAL